MFLTRPIQGRKASVGATACCILHGFSQTGEHATDIFAQQNGNSDERQGDGGRDQAVFDSRDAIAIGAIRQGSGTRLRSDVWT